MDKVTREKKLKVLLPVLVLVSAFVWAPVFQGGPGKKKDEKESFKKTVSTDDADLFAFALNARQGTERQKSLFTEWGRNPFVTERWSSQKVKESVQSEEGPGEKLVGERQIVVNGIFWSRHRPSALINDEVVGVGTRFGEYEVVAITKDKVTVTDGSENYDFMVQGVIQE